MRVDSGQGSATTGVIDPARVRTLLAQEEQTYRARLPRSRELHAQGQACLFGGVPMPWMQTWPTPFPLFFQEAQGSQLVDVDGNEYVDFCLGDSAAMGGHSPKPVVQAIADRASQGMTTMLPTADSIWVGNELARRFGLQIWQFTLSATDANRNAIRFARQITGRSKVLVFNYAYHGTVEESLVMKTDGAIQPRTQTIGSTSQSGHFTTVVEFNDVAGLDAALAGEDVACVLMEPAMTNIGIVLPAPGFNDEVRRLTRQHNTLLIVDETHTMCAGPSGATGAYGLEPDLVVMGKWLAGGVPTGALGMTSDVARRATDKGKGPIRGLSGVGSTVAGNALCMAATRSMLQDVLTDHAFTEMFQLARRWAEGVQHVITHFGVPWHVVQMGTRAEYRFRTTAPTNGTEGARVINAELDRYLHLGALNRGVLMTPFHSMALLSPAHTTADVDLHTAVFGELVGRLADPSPTQESRSK